MTYTVGFFGFNECSSSLFQVKIISKVQPDEVYNLAAQSHVKVSFEMAEYTAEVAGVGALRLLDAIKTCGKEKSVKFYQVLHILLFQ